MPWEDGSYRAPTDEERQQQPEAAAPTPPAAAELTGPGPAVYATWFFFLAAVGLAGFGLYAAYNEAEIVGGDAYNFLIASTRGAVWALAGVVSALAGLACQLGGTR